MNPVLEHNIKAMLVVYYHQIKFLKDKGMPVCPELKEFMSANEALLKAFSAGSN